MLFAKPLTLALALLFLLSLSSVKAQPSQSKDVAAKPAATSDTNPGNAAAKADPAVNQPPAAADKSANDHLPFMAESERESQAAAPSALGLLLRTLGALLLIIGLIVAAAWGMKRWGGARFGAPKEDSPELAILNSVGLGERRSVAIVRFGRRTLLIGSTPQSVTLLAETESEEITPRVQSVADILNETDDQDFAAELDTAAGRVEQSEWKTGEGVQW